MFTTLRDRGLVWPTLATIVAFAVLVALGTWQWQRMHWKRGLLDQLERTAAAAPVPLAEAIQAAAGTGGPVAEALRYHRVRLTGTFDNANELHVWSPERKGPAWQVVTPLHLAAPVTMPGGGTAATVLVMRGTIPEARKSPASRPDGQPAGPVTLTGRIRVDAPNASAPAPNLAKNQWFSRDLAAMRTKLEADGVSGPFAPFFVEALEQTGAGPGPVPSLEKLTLFNRHFEYALTWWGLAATLIAVYLAFAVTRRPDARRSD